MSLFDILIGISSVGSFVVAVIALFKINKVEKAITISQDSSNRAKQEIAGTKIEGSTVIQAGRDNRGI